MSFSDTSTSAPTSWSWDFGDGTTSTDQNPTKVYAVGGLFPVSLTSSNAFGSNIFVTNVGVVLRDGPFGVLIPQNSASWNAFQVWGINIPAPTIGWGCQEPTGTVLFPQAEPSVDPFVLTAIGTTHTYANSINGFQVRRFIGLSEAANARWSTTTASLDIALSESYAMMVFGSPVTGTVTARTYFQPQSTTDQVTMPTTGIRSVHNAANTTVVTASFMDTETPHLVTWFRNAPALKVGTTTDILHISGTNDFSLRAGATRAIGGTGVTTTRMKVGGVWIWKGVRSEQDWKQVTKWLGWPVTY